MEQGSNQKSTNLTGRHRTTPLPDSLTSIPGYPRKLTLYKLRASHYWWVRYFADGKIMRSSTRTGNKSSAVQFAKQFYDQVLLRRASGLALTNNTRFDVCVEAMLVAMRAQVARGELTQDTLEITEYRLKKSVLPQFGQRDIADITYDLLEKYLNQLSHQSPKISLSTIGSYIKLVRKVMGYAQKRGLLNGLPHFPTVATQDNPRGYFTKSELAQMLAAALELVGKRFDYRKLRDEQGQEQLGQYVIAGSTDEGRKVRGVEITRDLHDLIMFMVNSFIRPTDIKNLKHGHVEIVRGSSTYLRLNLPKSKKHDKPIVTLAEAVDVYERIAGRNKANGLGVSADDYVFMPQYRQRDHALKQLQRQFDSLMSHMKLGEDGKGAARTIYSLRHTCIMHRLLYGERMDVLTLARNARTSPEMIDRFYAAQLEGEDNVEVLQSQR